VHCPGFQTRLAYVADGKAAKARRDQDIAVFAAEEEKLRYENRIICHLQAHHVVQVSVFITLDLNLDHGETHDDI
jgi:hypothetical protein